MGWSRTVLDITAISVENRNFPTSRYLALHWWAAPWNIVTQNQWRRSIAKFGVHGAGVLKNIQYTCYVLILTLWDLPASQFDSTVLSSVLVARSGCNEKAIGASQYTVHITSRNLGAHLYLQYMYVPSLYFGWQTDRNCITISISHSACYGMLTHDKN